jgi:hypothetical protein
VGRAASVFLGTWAKPTKGGKALATGLGDLLEKHPMMVLSLGAFPAGEDPVFCLTWLEGDFVCFVRMFKYSLDFK